MLNLKALFLNFSDDSSILSKKLFSQVPFFGTFMVMSSPIQQAIPWQGPLPMSSWQKSLHRFKSIWKIRSAINYITYCLLPTMFSKRNPPFAQICVCFKHPAVWMPGPFVISLVKPIVIEGPCCRQSEIWNFLKKIIWRIKTYT